MVTFGEKTIQHWTCSSCGKVLTYLTDEAEEMRQAGGFVEVSHKVHFDIERSNKELWLENGDIEENEENRNLKMQRFLCEDCFLKVLNESPTLGKLFYHPAAHTFVY